MAVLVTRPAPDNLRTAAHLRACGYDALLAPLSDFAVCDADLTGHWSGLILTSANAARALAHNRALPGLKSLRVHAVGPQTREAALAAGFADVVVAGGDASALVTAIANEKETIAPHPLLYASGEETSRDLVADLGASGILVERRIVYRMVARPHFTLDVCDALRHGRIDVVTHFSRRSAELFLAAAKEAELSGAASRLWHICLSPQVGDPLRAANFAHVAVAAEPGEASLIATLMAAAPPFASPSRFPGDINRR